MTDGIEHRDVAVGASSLHLLECGPAEGPAVLFLHGWPQSAEAWLPVMTCAAAAGVRAVAMDLPGVGRSTGDATDGSTAAIAGVVRDLITAQGYDRPALVGHDVGGMITYSYLRAFGDTVSRAAIMDTVIPGVAPWEQVLANPYIWHFAFHSIPELPELLVQGNQRAYFDYFFDILSPPQGGGDPESRERSARAYASTDSLRAGFNWYRMLPRDAEENAAATGPVGTPLLYLRGEHEPGDLQDYIDGFGEAGLTDVSSAVIAGAGHFALQDAPDDVWAAIEAFLGLRRG